MHVLWDRLLAFIEYYKTKAVDTTTALKRKETPPNMVRVKRRSVKRFKRLNPLFLARPQSMSLEHYSRLLPKKVTSSVCTLSKQPSFRLGGRPNVHLRDKKVEISSRCRSVRITLCSHPLSHIGTVGAIPFEPKH